MAPQLAPSFVVAESFQLEGCVLVPGFSPDQRVKVGDCVLLRRPDGSFLRTTISAFELISRKPRPERFCAPIRLPGDVRRDAVPKGTVVSVLAPPAQPSDLFLLEVLGSFLLEGRGVVLTAAASVSTDAGAGQALVLVRPDGSTRGARVLDSSSLGPRSSSAPLLVDLTAREEAPRGTLVFVARD